MTENYFGITDTGKMRDNNEDAFIAGKILKGRYVLACVIDGVGGYEGGEVAANIARETILKYFSVPSGDMITMMNEAIRVANEKISEEKLKTAGHENMACVVTVAIADIENKKFYYGHIGDTRLYLFRDCSLVKITKDHSFVGFLEDSGRLSEEEAMNHPKRNEINKALGFNLQMKPGEEFIETGESPFLPGDILLLCSDGLSDMVSRAGISSILSDNTSIDEKAKALVAAANTAGGKDNITVVLVKNTDKPLKQKATKPVSIKKNDRQESESPANENTENTPGTLGKSPRVRSRAIIRLLTIFCGLLLGALVWSFFRWRPKKNGENTVLALQPNPFEKKLSDTLNLLSTTTLLMSDSLFSNPVYLNDTLFIQKDSLYILGSGNFVLKADSGYTGPAFMLSPECRYILFENIIFENFNVAILVQNKSLHLKNVRFKNCLVPVEYQSFFPNNNYVTGDLSDSTYFKTDSLSR